MPAQNETTAELAVSVRAPWWWYILHGGKDIENRDWPTRFRGPVYVHASKWWGARDVMEDAEWANGLSRLQLDPSRSEIRGLGGHIVGIVEIVDCVSASKSPWFFGKYGFVLRNPRSLPAPLPCKGALGFFRPNVGVLANAD